MPQPRLTLPHVVDIPASLDLLREIMPRRIPPIEIPKKLKTHPMTPSVSPAAAAAGPLVVVARLAAAAVQQVAGVLAGCSYIPRIRLLS